MPKDLMLSFSAHIEEEELGRVGKDPEWRVVRRVTPMVVEARWGVPIRECVEGLLVADTDRDPEPGDLPPSGELAEFARLLGFRELECGRPRRRDGRIEVPLGPKRPPRVGVIETLAMRHAVALGTVIWRSANRADTVNPVTGAKLGRCRAELTRLRRLLDQADPDQRSLLEEVARLASNAASLLTALELTFTDAPRLALAERMASAQRAGGASRAADDTEERFARMKELVDSGMPIKAAARKVAEKEHRGTAEELERATERNVKLYRRRMKGQRSPAGRGRPRKGRAEGAFPGSDPSGNVGT